MEMGDDGFLHPGRHAGPMSGMNSGGEGTAAGAVHAAFHVAAALVQRARTGEGCFIDVSGTEGVIAQAWIAATYTLNEHRIVDRSSMPADDEGRMTGAKYQYYQCADGKNVLFCCIEPKFWRNFCLAVGRADLLEAHRGGSGDDSGAGIDFGRGEDELRHELRPSSPPRPSPNGCSWPPSTTSRWAPPTGQCWRRPRTPTCASERRFTKPSTPGRPLHLRQRGRTRGRAALPDPPPRARAR